MSVVIGVKNNKGSAVKGTPKAKKPTPKKGKKSDD